MAMLCPVFKPIRREIGIQSVESYITMNWRRVLIVWELILSLSVVCYGCRVKFVNKEKPSEFCETCKKEAYEIGVCDKATGRPHRFRNLTVWRSKAVVPTNNVVDNTTEIEVDISGEYSPMVRGYLLIFMLDDGRTMCRSVMFPECKKPLASFSLAIDGIASMVPEMHQLMSDPAVTHDWISDVIISRSNSSYLKVTFDVKSRNVKWYAVELWDSLNNLIKSERTGKNYVIFRNITAGTYYTVVRILEVVEGSPSPCGRDVTDRRQPISCTDKRSELFEFPLRKTADINQNTSDDTYLVLSISLVFGGIVAVVGISVLVNIIRKRGCKRMLQRKRSSSVSLTIISTKCFPSKTIRKLEKTISAELNIKCKKLCLSRRNIVPINQISADIVVVILSRNSLDHMLALFEKPDKFSEKIIVFANADNTEYKASVLPRYPKFDISYDCDRLIKYLSISMTSKNHACMKKEDVPSELYGPWSNRGTSDLSFPDKDREKSIDVNSISYAIESVSQTIPPITLARTPVPRYSYTSHSDLGDSEVSTIFSGRSWFLPPDKDSDVDSAYVTQSECMKQINDSYDASRRTRKNNPGSLDVEAVSLGERSV